MNATKVIRTASIIGSRKLALSDDKGKPGNKAESSEEVEVEGDGFVPASESQDSRVPGYNSDLVDSLRQALKEKTEENNILRDKLETQESELGRFRKEIDHRNRAGYEDGRKEGESAARSEYAAALQELQSLVKQLKDNVSGKIEGLEHLVAELTVACVTRIIGKEYHNAEFVRDIVGNVISQTRDTSKIVIRVSRRDKVLIDGFMTHLADLFGGDIRTEVDNRVQSGGCLIETSSGSTDGRLETQLKILHDSLQEVVRELEVT